MAGSSYYYMREGQIVGPISSRRLRKYALDKRISPTDRIRRGTDGEWVIAGEVKGLFEPPLTSDPARRNDDTVD